MTLPASITKDLLTELTGLIASSGGKTYELLEVYTGDVITALPQSSPTDVVNAVGAARAAQRGGAALPRANRRAGPSPASTPPTWPARWPAR